jgi:homoserine kinase
MITVRVPASTSNLGAGFDWLGLALDLWLEARIVEGDSPAAFTGTLAKLDPAHDIVTKILGESMPADHHLELSSDIPVSRGLGSSAAAVVAGLALERLVGKRVPSREQIFQRGARLEGHPDNVAPAVYGGLVLAGDRPTLLTFHDDLAVALAVPDTSVDTKRARALLPDRVARGVAVEQAKRAAALVQGLVTGNGELLSFGMEDELAVPCRRSLITGFDLAVRAGTKAGAYGVTISGSGSGLVAIGPKGRTERIATTMAEALTTAGNPAIPLAPLVSSSGFSVVHSS